MDLHEPLWILIIQIVEVARLLHQVSILTHRLQNGAHVPPDELFILVESELEEIFEVHRLFIQHQELEQVNQGLVQMGLELLNYFLCTVVRVNGHYSSGADENLKDYDPNRPVIPDHVVTWNLPECPE